MKFVTVFHLLPDDIEVMKMTNGSTIDSFPHSEQCQVGESAIDEEIQHCLQWTSTAFSRLKKRVFKDNNIRADTKIMVYRAVVVPTLLDGSEMWTVYSRHFK
eukprot:g41840.t1